MVGPKRQDRKVMERQERKRRACSESNYRYKRACMLLQVAADRKLGRDEVTSGPGPPPQCIHRKKQKTGPTDRSDVKVLSDVPSRLGQHPLEFDGLEFLGKLVGTQGEHDVQVHRQAKQRRTCSVRRLHDHVIRSRRCEPR